MTFEFGHGHSLPPCCWEVASPECNEHGALNVLHAGVKSSIYNPSAATPVLAAKNCPDSHWLSVFGSHWEQAKDSLYNPSAATPALAAKNFPEQAKETNNDSIRTPDVHEQKNESTNMYTVDSIRLLTLNSSIRPKAQYFQGRSNMTSDSHWLSTDIRERNDSKWLSIIISDWQQYQIFCQQK